MAEINYGRAINTDLMAYVVEVAKALAALPKGSSMHVDNVPVFWFDDVIGHLVLSEIDGESPFDFVPNESLIG